MKARIGIGLVVCAVRALAESSLPQLIEAFVPLHAPGQIAVSFDETMSSDALDVFNYFVYETESPQTELQLLDATFANPPINSVVLLTPMGVINPTKAYTFNVVGGYISDLGGNYVTDVTRPLRRERFLLAADREQEWKYHAQGVNLGSSWIEPPYDDSSWSNGRALFYAAAYGPPSDAPVQPGTSLPTFDSSGQLINKFYFRTKVYSPFTGVTSLRVRSISDEGGRMYIDGNPVQSFTRPPNHNWSPPANTFGATIPVRLAEGQHVVAFEADRYYASRPLAMAVTVTAIAEGVCACPLQFAEDLIVTYNFGVPELRVRVIGTDPQYQWFKDGSQIPNATNRAYILPNSSCASGQYWVRVTNQVSTIESRHEWAWVGDGPEPPTLYSAIGEVSRTTIRLQWDRPLPSAWLTNTENYRLNGLTISNISLLSNNRIRLHTEQREPGRLYELTVLNTVRATCLTSTNIVYPDIHRTIDLEESILWYDAVWACHDLGTDLGTDWRLPSYDDSAWPRGQALLGVESPSTLSNLQPRGIALSTSLQIANNFARSTYYFRRQFENIFPSVTQFYLTHVIDDGAIFYLDGVELARFNMPSSPIDYYTLATSGFEATYRTNGVYTITPGPHVLAVEVHQSSLTSSDVVFGAAFEVFLPPVAIRVHRLPGGEFAIETRNDFFIETAPSPTGPWSFWSFGRTSFIQPDGPQRFFRARRD